MEDDFQQQAGTKGELLFWLAAFCEKFAPPQTKKRTKICTHTFLIVNNSLKDEKSIKKNVKISYEAKKNL